MGIQYANKADAEQQAEERAEREQDRLDKRYLRGELSQGEYDASTWAIEQRVRRAVADWRR